MPQNLVALDMESLKDVKGGLVSLMMAKALQRAAIDIEAAPDITENRVVTLEIRMKPVLERMELSHVVTEFVVKGKVPARVTSAAMLVRPTENGSRQLVFNLDAQDNPAQQTLLPVGGDPDDEDEDEDDDQD